MSKYSDSKIQDEGDLALAIVEWFGSQSEDLPPSRIEEFASRLDLAEGFVPGTDAIAAMVREYIAMNRELEAGDAPGGAPSGIIALGPGTVVDPTFLEDDGLLTYCRMINAMLDFVIDGTGDASRATSKYLYGEGGLILSRSRKGRSGSVYAIVQRGSAGSARDPVYQVENNHSFLTRPDSLLERNIPGGWTELLFKLVLASIDCVHAGVDGRHAGDGALGARAGEIPPAAGLPERHLVSIGRYMGEPILWRAFHEEGKMLLVSERIIDFQAFDDDGLAPFGDASITTFLNESFAFEAFSSQEAALVDPERGVFLINVRQAESLFESDEDRMAWPSAYAARSQACNNVTGAVSWWLSGGSPDIGYAPIVTARGRICEEPGACPDRVDIGVRPAFYLVRPQKDR